MFCFAPQKKMLLGDIFPNLALTTTDGEFDLHDWLGDSWGILFSHPSDFTPVCTTELAHLVKLHPEFQKRNVKIIGISCDTVASHLEWCKDIKTYAGSSQDEKFPYPIIEDEGRKIAKMLGMIDTEELDAAGTPLTARGVFVIDPNKKYRLSLLYPATTGRNFDFRGVFGTVCDSGSYSRMSLKCTCDHKSTDLYLSIDSNLKHAIDSETTLGVPLSEILRVIDALQLTDKAKVATPANWKMGDDCMVLPSVPEGEAARIFPQGVTKVALPSGKNYLRKTPCPKFD